MSDDKRRESFRFSSHTGQAGKQDIVKTGFEVVGHLREGKERARRAVAKSDSKLQEIDREDREAADRHAEYSCVRWENWKQRVRADAKAARETVAGSDTFGGIEISWQTPPAVRVIPSERDYIQMFIGFQHPTGILASIDGEDVHRKSRAHIVGLLEDFRGSIKVIPTDSFRAAMWISAQEALLRSSGSHPDAESKEGSDWMWRWVTMW